MRFLNIFQHVYLMKRKYKNIYAFK